MLHIVRSIQHRYPSQSNRIIVSLVALSASALLVGTGMLLLQ
jgi:hypothetical protein